MLSHYFQSHLLSIRNSSRRQRRHFSLIAKAVAFNCYGPPEKVLSVKQYSLPKLSPSSLYIQFLASPINPADINQIQGTYPSKPIYCDDLGFVGGNEGVAKVIAVGKDVQSLSEGDLVVPAVPALGTWRSHALVKADDVRKVPSDIPILNLATLNVSTCTAYRLLHDFVPLVEGDTIVQNGANSAVGQAVIQIANSRNVKTVNIVRDRPNIDEMKSELESLGATYVVTENNLRRDSNKIMGIVGKDKSISLGLNCVGGSSSTNVARMLGQDGVLVTYGGMSREPVVVPTSLFIFKNLTATGFWMTRWNASAEIGTKQSTMLRDIYQLIYENKLKPPFTEIVELGADENPESWKLKILETVKLAGKGFGGKKVVLSMA